jgi:hypothetical protein
MVQAASASSAAQPSPVRADFAGAAVRFEYTGATGLTVRGPITGRNYRFKAPGEHVAVDGRDAPGMMAVPRLRPAR